MNIKLIAAYYNLNLLSKQVAIDYANNALEQGDDSEEVIELVSNCDLNIEEALALIGRLVRKQCPNDFSIHQCEKIIFNHKLTEILLDTSRLEDILYFCIHEIFDRNSRVGATGEYLAAANIFGLFRFYLDEPCDKQREFIRTKLICKISSYLSLNQIK